ncbi:6-methylsalicylic acid synthase [Xylaria telfairii]|nr:6-methylsalicylic acid synthase [Xylaria telfairii]
MVANSTSRADTSVNGFPDTRPNTTRRNNAIDRSEAQISSTDVAIIGMSCRTAGGVNSPEKLWQLLLSKKDASGEVPQHRWEPWLRRDPRNKKQLEKTVSKGYFIEDLENFDASFFGISPKEAEQMDPHQRLGLELAWEALENAGIDPKGLSGSDTAVYMGCDSDDYSRLLLEDIPNIEAWMGIGTAAHGIPNRISYHLDLMGPSAAVDAACASSLVAVHLGYQAILNGESEVAIVGGVNVLLAPALTRMLGKAGALSPEGICRSFDDDANGYARGEGGAIVILKKLSSAITDGDKILSVLKGSAIAQDGKTNGIMAPNTKAQELVGRWAVKRAGINPLSVAYVEAHATSTPLGDPTEVSAIAALYGDGAGRAVNSPVYLGSIKPNVGHLEAAAGAIGLVKAVLAINKGQLAPQARLNKLNRRIDWDKSALHVVRKAMPWPKSDGPKRAAVCCYGYGGTVSHAIIQEAPISVNSISAEKPVGPLILMLSSPQQKRLIEQARQLAQWLDSPEGMDHSLTDVANTLAQHRSHHDYRAAFVVEKREDAISALSEFATDPQHDNQNIIQRRVLGPNAPICMIFSGHGAQYKNMGIELLQNPVFFRTITALDGIVRKEAEFSAIECLQTGDFDTADRVQILTYVIQIGLYEVLSSQGLAPQAVIGHSVGEIAASVVAGCLTREEGLLIVARRARLYAQLRGQISGAMSLINLPYSVVAEELQGREDLVAAIDSSPSTCVVSGEAKSVAKYVEDLKARNIRTFRVNTDVPFHSPMLKPYMKALEKALDGGIYPQKFTLPLYSTSNADPRTTVLRDIQYWQTNTVYPVLLKSAVNAAVEDGYRIFVEVSSHPIVLNSVDDTILDSGLSDEDFKTIPTMKRDSPASKNIHKAVAIAYTAGARINFEAQFGHRGKWCREVPGTPWLHKPYYRQVETSASGQAEVHDIEKHTILGHRTAIAGTDTVIFSTKLDDKTKPYPGLHPLDGTEIIPAAVYINTFHHATRATVFSNIKLRVPVSMGPDTRNVQIIIDGNSIRVASSPQDIGDSSEQTWLSHSSAQWNQGKTFDGSSQEKIDIGLIQKRIGTILPNSFATDYLAKIGVEGIAFPWQVVEHYGNSKEMMVKVDMDPSVQVLPWDEHSWAPLLDAATSVGSAIFFHDIKLKIVSGIDRVNIYSCKPPPKIGYLFIEDSSDAKTPAADVTVLDSQGLLLAKFTSMRFSEVEGARGVSGGVDSLVHRIAWVPPKFSETVRELGDVVLVSSDPERFVKQVSRHAKTLFQASSATQIEGEVEKVAPILAKNGSTLIFIPRHVESLDEVPRAAEEIIWEAATLVKFMANHALACKFYIISNGVQAGETATGLAHAPLYGLARIIGSEHPDIWGGLIDTETDATFPLTAIKYVQEQDVLRMVDGLPRRPIMRPFTREYRQKPDSTKTIMPTPEGTYLITGGLGDLGLATCEFLIKKGARRIVLVSRRGLPSRSQWPKLVADDTRLKGIVDRIVQFEKLGATIYPIAFDISSPNGAEVLVATLDKLSLPPVLGVIHGAGVLGGSLLVDTTREAYAQVFSPKIDGALTLHKAFPPGSLDFFVLYSSIGQLVGTEGQAAYASSNAFLDGLASYRRTRGDNAVAFQFTAWLGLGLVRDLTFLNDELQSKGITGITPDEAFRAWEHVNKFDVEGAVVTRVCSIAEGDPAPLPILEDVVVRRPAARGTPDTSSSSRDSDSGPAEKGDRQQWLTTKIRECIAAVLMISDIDEIDIRKPLVDFGVDSVMTVALRQKLQMAFKVKVPATLTWNHPTVNHLVAWFLSSIKD